MSSYLAWRLPFFAILTMGVVTGLYYYRQKKNLRPVIILLAITLLAEIIAYFMGKYFRNAMPVAHFFNPVQLGIWAIFFYRVYEESRVKKIVLWLTAGMLIFAVINSVFLQPLKTFPDNFLKLETTLFILWGGYLFMRRLDTPSHISIFKDPLFVIAVAILWFNLLSFSFFLLQAYVGAEQLAFRLISIHLISNYIYYLLLSIAIALPQKQLQHEGELL